MEGEGFPRAEEAVRLLATACGAARLYPPTSALPAEAVRKFTERVNEISGVQGPLRYQIDPHGFRIGDAELAAGQSQVVALAESLHSMQVGQLIIAPGITEAEVFAFVEVSNADTKQVRSSGGARSALVNSGVTHIAVIEVSLRATDEDEITGVDLMTAPLDEIAPQVANAAERWAKDGVAPDVMMRAIASLEDAAREIAMERVAQAMMLLDEPTRMRVLNWSLKPDANGARMDGMLDVIARMKPAALARLLKLVAAQAGTDPGRIAGVLTLPPDTAKALAILLAPTPTVEPDFGIAPIEQAQALAAEVAAEDDDFDLDRQIALAPPTLAAGRELATAVAISASHADREAVQAIADSLPDAARDGAFVGVREALRRLDELAQDPALTDEVSAARTSLADPSVLSDVCRAVMTDADAAIAGEILHAAGPLGAEVLLDAYTRSVEPTRSLLRPVLRGQSEGILGVARQRLRTSQPGAAAAILRTLPLLGDKRVIPVIAEQLDSLDESVRFTAANALASIPVPEATAALVKALGHREPETQRQIVRELGRVRSAAAVPALGRALEDISSMGRTHETRKEIIRALQSIGTPEAEKVLRRFAGRTLGLRKKSRELRTMAIEAANAIAQERGVDTR